MNATSSRFALDSSAIGVCVISLLPSAVTASPANDWVSIHNGPTNSRRAAGQVFADNWQIIWQSQFTGAEPVVKDGIVVFQNNPADTRTYSGVNLADGTVLWTQIVNSPVNPTTAWSNQGNAIVGDHVIINCNRAPMSTVLDPTRIDCLDLTTGAVRWSYAPGGFRNIWALQAIDSPTPSSTNPNRIAFMTSVNPSVGLPAGSLTILDDYGSVPNAHNLSLGAASEWSPAPLFAVWGPIPSVPSYSIIHDANWGSNRVSVSTQLVVTDFAALATPAPPFSSNPLLSNSSVSNAPYSVALCPIVADCGAFGCGQGARAVVMDTSSRLYAFDLTNGTQSWSTSISPQNCNSFVYGLAGIGRLVVMVPGSAQAPVVDVSTGAVVASVSLPAGVTGWSACVLDNDELLMSLSNGEVRLLTNASTLSAPVITVPGLISAIAVDGCYLVRAGNVLQCYKPACNRTFYCTSSTTSHGCSPAIYCNGTPSATAPNGFTISVTSVEGQKSGLIFYGVSGRIATVWSPGSTSFLCVKSPTQRMLAQDSGGSAAQCNGSYSSDWNDYVFTHPSALGAPFSVGQVVNTQAWFRDPGAPGTTNLSDALEFSICP